MLDLSRHQEKNSSILSFLVITIILSSLLLAPLPGGNYINIGAAAVMVGITILYIIIGNRSIYGSPELFIISLWLIYALIPSIFAVDQEQAMDKALSVLQILFLAFITLQVMIWKNSAKIFIWTYVIAMCLSYAVTFTELNDYIAVISKGVDDAGSQERTAGTLGNAVTFGVTAVFAQSLVVVLLTDARVAALEKIAAIIALIVLTAAVINSGSRTAMLGSILLLVGQLWVFSLWKPTKFVKILLWGSIMTLVGGAFIYMVKDLSEIQDRYYEMIDSVQLEARIMDFINIVLSESKEGVVERSGESIEIRVKLAKMSWNIVNEYPFGVGLDNFSVYAGRYSHSNYLEIMTGTGFIGLLIYYSSYMILLIKSLKVWLVFPSYSRPKALILCILVLGLTDVQNVSYYDKTTILFLVLIIASVEHMRRDIVRTKSVATRH